MNVVSKRQKELGLPEPWREEVALDGSETKMRHNYLKRMFCSVTFVNAWCCCQIKRLVAGKI